MSFCKPRTVFSKRLSREAAASRHINVVGHYDDKTLMDKDGKLIRLFRLQGLPYRLTSPAILDQEKQRRHSFLKSLGAGCAFYSWTVHRPMSEFLRGAFSQGYANELHERYFTQFQERPLFSHDLYVGMVVQSPLPRLKVFDVLKRPAFHLFEKTSVGSPTRSDLYEKLTEASKKLESTFSHYHIQPLGVIQKGDCYFSEALAFLGYLMNGEFHAIPLLKTCASHYLPCQRLFFNARSGMIETRNAQGVSAYAAIVGIKAYDGITYAGIFDALNALRMEYLMTQSYRPYDTQTAKTRLRQQQHDLIQSQDDSITQTAQISESLDETAGREVGYGRYHFTLLCRAKSQELLKDHIADIHAVFSANDMVCVREDVASELSFWAQLPGNVAYIARHAILSTKNVASFISLHNEPKGQCEKNHWGDAVTVLETPASSPYYFNFHVRDVGNTFIAGSMGSGKTLLMGFLFAQSMKYGGKRLVFDKDRGLEMVVRALGGHYEVIRPGMPTGFNPCQLEDTPENRQFLMQLLKTLCQRESAHDTRKDAEREVITTVIDRLYALPKETRQFRHLAPFFGIKKPGSLRSHFDAWHSEGAHAWLFDNETDHVNLASDIMGFELGALLKDSACHTPALMYLLHCGIKSLEGQRGGIFMDEGWQALNHAYFKTLINDLGRTPRKKNHFLCLATQSVEDAVNQDVCHAFITSCANKIVFPNRSALQETYQDKLGLTTKEFDWVKTTLPEEGFYFLLTRGQGEEAVIARANFEGLEDDIALISGRTKTVQLLDSIRQETGDDPQKWLSVFHQRRKKDA